MGPGNRPLFPMPRGEFLDYDPLTGVAEYYEETSDGKGHVHTYQDVQPYLDRCERLRNEGSTDEVFRRDGVAMYADLPLTVVGEMMKKGINVFDQNDMPKVIQEIETNYSRFKTTYKHHALRKK
jgi:hypothetical protein